MGGHACCCDDIIHIMHCHIFVDGKYFADCLVLVGTGSSRSDLYQIYMCKEVDPLKKSTVIIHCVKKLTA